MSEQHVNPPTADLADEATPAEETPAEETPAEETPAEETPAEETVTEVTPSPEKDPDDWVTGDEPMTGPQESYLHTLAQEAGAEVPAGLDKAAASKLIDELQARTGRGGA